MYQLFPRAIVPGNIGLTIDEIQPPFDQRLWATYRQSSSFQFAIVAANLVPGNAAKSYRHPVLDYAPIDAPTSEESMRADA